MPTSTAIIKIARLRDQTHGPRGGNSANLIGQHLAGLNGSNSPILRTSQTVHARDDAKFRGGMPKWVEDTVTGDLKLIID